MEFNKAVFKTALILAMVFIIGFLSAIGTVAMIWKFKLRSAPFMGNPVQTLQRLTTLLNLDEKQQAAVGQILRQTRADLKSLREEVRPKVRQRLEQTRQEIAALLKAEQKTKFAELVERRKEQYRRWQERRSRWMNETD